MREWLDDLNLPNLGRGKNIAMGRTVADFFKIGKLQSVTDHSQTAQNKYPESFVPVIKKAYQYMLFANN